jgi:hypothetical protein
MTCGPLWQFLIFPGISENELNFGNSQNIPCLSENYVLYIKMFRKIRSIF